MKIITQPWIGEFGWELFGWQAFMRAYNKTTDAEMVCITRPGREILYEDFAKVETISVSGQGDGPACHNMKLDRDKMEELQTKYAGSSMIPVQLFNYVGKPLLTDKGEFAPEFVAYGQDDKIEKYDVIFHMRHREFRADDNWSKENWIKLAEMCDAKGISYACMGSKDEALCMDSADDLRGIELRELVRYLAGSKCIVGPSSGPMHLATLCKCPQLVWSGAEKNRRRYEVEWNPFDVKVLYMGEEFGGWQPEPDTVFSKLQEML